MPRVISSALYKSSVFLFFKLEKEYIDGKTPVYDLIILKVLGLAQRQSHLIFRCCFRHFLNWARVDMVVILTEPNSVKTNIQNVGVELVR